MTKEELQEIKERLELWEYVGKLQQIPDWQGKPFTPYAQYLDDIRRLLDEVNRLEVEYGELAEHSAAFEQLWFQEKNNALKLGEELLAWKSSLKVSSTIRRLGEENEKLKNELKEANEELESWRLDYKNRLQL